MATYYLYSGAGGTATGADWTNAFLTLTAALAAATTAGDVIKVHKTHTEELAVDTTYTLGANISIICVDKDASDVLAQMGTSAWIGNSTTNRTIVVDGAQKQSFWYGITLRTAGATSDSINIIGDGSHMVFEDGYLWNGNSNSTARIFITAADKTAFVHLKNSVLRFGNTAQSLFVSGVLLMEGGSLSGSGSIPTTLIGAGTVDMTGSEITFSGVDLSALGSSTILGDNSVATPHVKLVNCKLGTGFVALAATLTNSGYSAGEVFLYNCSTGDNNYEFGHYTALGSLVAVTSPYVSDGALYDGTNHVTWKIITTSAASFGTPYVSPWIEKYHSGTSSITPNIEGLKINDATVAQDDEVWAEFSYQGTTGYPLASFSSDRMVPLGTAANQTSSKTYSDWTASPATDSGDSVFKLQSASITPAEIGMLMARVCVGAPSVTVYVDPKIRT